jgi:hypothetical protein
MFLAKYLLNRMRVLYLNELTRHIYIYTYIYIPIYIYIYIGIYIYQPNHPR